MSTRRRQAGRKPSTLSQSSNRHPPSPSDTMPPRPGSPQSNREEYLRQLAESMDLSRRRWEEERRRPPAPLPLQPSILLLASVNQQRQAAMDAEKRKTVFRQTVCGDEKNFSQAKVKDLKRISLREMKVRKVHRGRYLLVRTATLVSRYVALNIGVVDPNGDAILLGLYNYPLLPLSLGTSPKVADIDECVSIGTILLIKEPWGKMGLQGDSALVRVDSPTDVLIVKKGDPLLEGVKWAEIMGAGFWKVPTEPKRTLDEWKTKGNKHLTSRLFLLAEKSYTLGIEQHPSHPDLHLLFLNRAAVNLTLERFNAALADSTRALSLLLNNTSLPPDKLNNFRVKAHHRRTSSLYSLRRWSEAKDAFVEFLAAHPNSVEGSVGLARTEDRLREAVTGEYNLVELFKKAEQDPSPRMDIADFVGPVEVVSLEGRGRGIITTRNVKAGELLLATKAIRMAHPKDREPNDTPLGLNFLTNRGESPEHVNLRSSLVYHLFFQPELLPLLTELYSGPSFPSPPSSYDLHPRPPLPPGTPTPPINIPLLEAASSFNAFSPANPKTASFLHDPTDPKGEHPVAIFCPNSLLNHACLYTSSWTCFGDFQLVRAKVNLPPGSEVTISYVGDQEYEERTTRLAKYLEGSPSKLCSCELCEADRKDGMRNLARRAKILERRPGGRSRVGDEASLPRIRQEIKTVEKEIEDLETTYHRDRGALRPELYGFYQVLGHLHGIIAYNTKDISPYRRVVEYQILAVESVGVGVVNKSNPRVVNSQDASLPISSAARVKSGFAACSALQVAMAYNCLEEESLARSWVRAAIWMEDVAVGGGKELFRVRYKTMLETLGLMEFAM